MGKKDRSEKLSKKEKTSTATLPEKKIDPSLASLFESSFGAVKAPIKPARILSEGSEEQGHNDEKNDVDADADLSEVDEEIADLEDTEDPTDPVPEVAKVTITDKKRKRKRKEENGELEDAYLRKLQDEEDAAEEERRRKRNKQLAKKAGISVPESEKDSLEDESDRKEESEFQIKHETLRDEKQIEIDKAARTVFLGNVPSTVVSSKPEYKLLKSHFTTGAGPIESVRFRSIAFSEQIPRKAAFITHKFHEKQQTLNAYIVFKTAAAAREALKLNGVVLLDRHIRVDSVAHPAPHDAKRCVFVGNLDFEAQEESLWKHFSIAGKVESVRIVRDAKTNVGKGFAYVQFEDVMAVDEALLLHEKRMPNDRKLRVTRARAIKRNAKRSTENDGDRRPDPTSRRPRDNIKGSVYQPKVDPRKRDQLNRASKILGRAAAAQLKSQGDVFEGLRATANTDSGIKKGGSGKKAGKPRARAVARSQAWKVKNAK